MGSLAVSRLEVADQPPRSVADDVAAIARNELAPLAAAIDSGEVYPDALLRRFGEAGAWSSHMPENGAADLRCAIQSIAAIGEICGATAFMAWCQNTLVWYAANSDNPRLVAKLAGSFAGGKMATPNRVILTAARRDRPSFGCQVHRTYNFFDECLLGTLPKSATWRAAFDWTKGCVRHMKQVLGERPSEPQAYFGAAVADSALERLERRQLGQRARAIIGGGLDKMDKGVVLQPQRQIAQVPR